MEDNNYIKELQKEIEIVKERLKEGKQEVYDNVEDLFKALEED